MGTRAASVGLAVAVVLAVRRCPLPHRPGCLRESIRVRVPDDQTVSFFEPPPPPPEPPTPERFDTPEWWGPPDDVFGGVVALELLLARSEQAAVVIESATAYPTGVEFTIDVRWREQSPEWRWPSREWRWSRFEHRRSRSGELPDELFRAGVQFADGSKATTLESGLDVPVAVSDEEHDVAFSVAGVVADDEESQVPEGPLLVPRGGGGGGQRYSQSFWLWPLPPEGPLTFVCEWPALDIGLSRVEIDSALIREAAARSRTLWEDGPEV